MYMIHSSHSLHHLPSPPKSQHVGSVFPSLWFEAVIQQGALERDNLGEVYADKHLKTLIFQSPTLTDNRLLGQWSAWRLWMWSGSDHSWWYQMSVWNRFGEFCSKIEMIQIVERKKKCWVLSKATPEHTVPPQLTTKPLKQLMLATIISFKCCLAQQINPVRPSGFTFFSLFSAFLHQNFSTSPECRLLRLNKETRAPAGTTEGSKKRLAVSTNHQPLGQHTAPLHAHVFPYIKYPLLNICWRLQTFTLCQEATANSHLKGWRNVAQKGCLTTKLNKNPCYFWRKHESWHCFLKRLIKFCQFNVI